MLGPFRVADGVLALHTPHPRDGAGWSRARLANRAWLERAFPAWGADWEADQTPVSWTERARLQRRARSRGIEPFVIRLDGHIIGEAGIDAVDAETATGEASSWVVRDHAPDIMRTAMLALLQHVVTRDPALQRVLGPVSVAAREGRRRSMTELGFRLGPAVPRRVGDRVIDHDYWVLENTEENRAHLAATLAMVEVGREAQILDRGSAGQTMRWRARASLRRVRARLRHRRRSGRQVPAPLVLAGAGTTSELVVTAVGPRERRGPRAAGRLASADLTATITRGDSIVATVGLRHDAGTGALRASLVGAVAEPDLPTVLDALEATAVAWWPESVALECKHTSTEGPAADTLRSRGYVAALDEGVTTLWVRPRAQAA